MGKVIWLKQGGEGMSQQEIRAAVEILKDIAQAKDGGVLGIKPTESIKTLIDIAQLVLEIKGVCDHTVSENCLDCDTCKIAECHNRGFNQANSQWRALIAKKLLEVEDVLKETVLFYYETIGTRNTPSEKQPRRLCDFKVKDKHIKALSTAIKNLFLKEVGE